LLAACFHQVLELAAEARVSKVGELTVAIDGPKLLANAGKHSAMSHDHVEEQLKLAEANCWPRPRKPTAFRCRTG
jgi:hypothetical protein